MEAFLTSAALVAFAEMGDKTQLLVMTLAGRYRRPWPIVAGVFVATLLTHSLAVLIGVQAARLIDGPWLPFVVAAAFIAMGLWMLVPEAEEETDEGPEARGRGLFVMTFLFFLLAELGDKSQIAALTLGARFDSLLPVVAGTVTGEMLAILPAILLGPWLLRRLSGAWIRRGAALLFVIMGVFQLLHALDIW